MLPARPLWKCTLRKTVYPTKHPIKPLRVFKTAEKLMRIYSEWRTGDVAWKMQVSGHLSISINLRWHWYRHPCHRFSNESIKPHFYFTRGVLEARLTHKWIENVVIKEISFLLVIYKQFGDAFQHEPRTASTTLAQLMEIESRAEIGLWQNHCLS